ncbi:MAG: hypothetical protein J5967_02755, partial [Oscillospiraceae bacterium]|nr:hypothetical protein [Oscillospiraceae bacterium]
PFFESGASRCRWQMQAQRLIRSRANATRGKRATRSLLANATRGKRVTRSLQAVAKQARQRHCGKAEEPFFPRRERTVLDLRSPVSANSER